MIGSSRYHPLAPPRQSGMSQDLYDYLYAPTGGPARMPAAGATGDMPWQTAKPAAATTAATTDTSATSASAARPEPSGSGGANDGRDVGGSSPASGGGPGFGTNFSSDYATAMGIGGSFLGPLGSAAATAIGTGIDVRNANNLAETIGLGQPVDYGRALMDNMSFGLTDTSPKDQVQGLVSELDAAGIGWQGPAYSPGERPSEQNDGASSGGGGCYITTAAVNHGGLADDGEELSALRSFRDGVMTKTPQGQAEIAAYEKMAPEIEKRLSSRPDSSGVYRRLLQTYIRPAADAVKKGDFDTAHLLYREMVGETAMLAGMEGEGDGP